MSRHDIMVIGASAGGVDALPRLIGSLPSSLPASVFIVLHISPQGPDLLPDHHLQVDGPRIRLFRGPRENFHRPSSDTLFRSATETCGRRVAGVVNHFLHPQAYLTMIPPFLPFPRAMNVISGGAEIVGGIAVLFPRFQRAAGWWLIALPLAVFPANLHVALHGWDGVRIPAWILWVRLPLQVALVAWVYASCLATHQRNARRERHSVIK